MATGAPAFHPAPHRPGHIAQPEEAQTVDPVRERIETTRRYDAERLRLSRDRWYALGRLLVALLFVVSGLVKVVRFVPIRDALLEMGLSGAVAILTLAIFVELVGGVMLAIGLWVRQSAAVLIAYLAGVTLLINGDMSVAFNRASALANLAFAGALMLLVAHGSGLFSVDHVIERRQLSK